MTLEFSSDDGVVSKNISLTVRDGADAQGKHSSMQNMNNPFQLTWNIAKENTKTVNATFIMTTNNSAYSQCGHYTFAVVILVVRFADLLIAFFPSELKRLCS